MTPLFGMFSWLAAGLAIGALGRVLLAVTPLSGAPPLGWPAALAAALGGALFGGLLATALGFGGLGAFDVRSLTTALLGAVLVLLIVRTATLAEA